MKPPTSQPPPIPRQHRHQSRQQALQNHHPAQPPSAYPRTADGRPREGSLSTTSPEVISSLITSLSVISKPASNHFEGPGSSVPPSPGLGSFGVDYGAYSHAFLEDETGNSVSLDEIAASSPVIRTSKPPSGFSPLTAPKSPAREPGGLKSILRSASRPSSKGSLGSRDDANSIGNLSIERGAAPQGELRKQRSHDSWGKKQGRGHKGLMYMTSKERLREKELDRRRTSIGGSDGRNSPALSARTDQFLGDMPITEEQSVHDSPNPANLERPSNSSIDLSNPRPIPTRDSSLRKTGSGAAKRSSTRHSRSKRDDASTSSNAIPEHDERSDSRDASSNRRSHPTRGAEPTKAGGTTYSNVSHYKNTTLKPSALPATTRPHPSTNTSRASNTEPQPHVADEVEDDFAPFPSVSQGRRRDASYDRGRRRSGQYLSDPGEAIRLKRSSSKMKRGSGPLSPRLDDKTDANSRSRLSSPDPRSSVLNGYERPLSADSVDDAVESYLCSPRLSQKIKHPQTGRVISFSEVGDSDGHAVICCVGMGLTRYITAFYDELALTLKLRLITPDRPGIGDSEAYPGGSVTPLSWPDDVYAICQALKITKFSILAHSAGAIYALATALRMPQHIRGRIHLLSPWIPPSQMNVFGASENRPPTNAIPTSQRILRALPTTILKAANSSFMTATSSSITSSLPKQRRGKRRSTTGNKDAPTIVHTAAGPGHDKENMGHGGIGSEPPPVPPPKGADGGAPPSGTSAATATGDMDRVRPSNRSRAGQQAEGAGVSERSVLAAAATAVADKERQVTYDTRLTHAIWELATTGANPAVDLLVCLERQHTIGFRYVDITRPVVIHHGSRDSRVPVENVRWLGKSMKRCEVRVLEGEGHGLMASAGVMGGVLMEISKEWEDWTRATGGGGTAKKERGRRGTLVR